MNKVNFLNKDNFPLYSEGLAKLQNAIFLTANLALLGGGRYILSGCTESVVNNVATISDGLVVVDGEILELVGAAKKDKITIREVKTSLSAFGVDYPESYVTRYVEFSATGEYNWADFEKIPTNQYLYRQIKNITGDPAGIVKEFAGFASKIPQDYMLCDGRELSTTEYPELFEALGTIYGGDGSNTFRLPNAGGRVVVGYSGTGDYKSVGLTGGADSITLTEKQIPSHKHIYPWGENPTTAWSPPWDYAEGYIGNQRGSNGTDNDNAWAYTSPVGGGEGHENRQAFIVFAKIIKVR